MGEEHCVCCGSLIPEGRQVCYNCEHKENVYHCIVCGKTIPKPKFSFGGRANGKTMMILNYNIRQICCSDECFQDIVMTIQNDYNKTQ